MAEKAPTRPQVTVFSVEGKRSKAVGHVALPDVFLAPIRPDIVTRVHTNMAKNARQPYAVAEEAGTQVSAHSWGTGRAVARIPRVAGGGTHRAGQGAFGNMCRGGRMFSPTKIWRRWHRKINVTEKRVALASALAATAVPSLVMARGHRIPRVNEIPLVVSNDVEKITKTKEAIAVLKKLEAYEDVRKVMKSRQLRAGAGKSRNRRWVVRRGPLVVYKKDNGITRAFRNIPGVELCKVSKLNLLQLAPGSHLGRFLIWTQGALEELNNIFGTYTGASSQKKGFRLPSPMLKNANLARIINSERVQAHLRPKKRVERYHKHKNLLSNLRAASELQPAVLIERRRKLKTMRKALAKNVKQNVFNKDAKKAKKEARKLSKKHTAWLKAD